MNLVDICEEIRKANGKDRSEWTNTDFEDAAVLINERLQEDIEPVLALEVIRRQMNPSWWKPEHAFKNMKLKRLRELVEIERRRDAQADYWAEITRMREECPHSVRGGLVRTRGGRPRCRACAGLEPEEETVPVATVEDVKRTERTVKLPDRVKRMLLGDFYEVLVDDGLGGMA